MSTTMKLMARMRMKDAAVGQDMTDAEMRAALLKSLEHGDFATLVEIHSTHKDDSYESSRKALVRKHSLWRKLARSTRRTRVSSAESMISHSGAMKKQKKGKGLVHHVENGTRASAGSFRRATDVERKDTPRSTAPGLRTGAPGEIVLSSDEMKSASFVVPETIWPLIALVKIRGRPSEDESSWSKRTRPQLQPSKTTTLEEIKKLATMSSR
jgi:hypothetical protein